MDVKLSRERKSLIKCMYLLGKVCCDVYKGEKKKSMKIHRPFFQVSWFRKDDGMLQVLTIGKDTFVADQRFSSAWENNDWRLKIQPAQAGDSGAYLCQISTHPPTLLVTHLQVIGKSAVNRQLVSKPPERNCQTFSLSGLSHCLAGCSSASPLKAEKPIFKVSTLFEKNQICRSIIEAFFSCST